MRFVSSIQFSGFYEVCYIGAKLPGYLEIIGSGIVI